MKENILRALETEYRIQNALEEVSYADFYELAIVDLMIKSMEKEKDYDCDD